MIARNTSADVNVVALIGERGREVNEFIENDLGPEGLARSVVIVTPSNSPPLARLRGAYVATAVAEYFRDEGLDVGGGGLGFEQGVVAQLGQLAAAKGHGFS